jgi:hypothetical protein
VLANDTDVNGDILHAVLGQGPTHDSLALNADGSFTYTPGANYNGPDSFTYVATDPSGAVSATTTSPWTGAPAMTDWPEGAAMTGSSSTPASGTTR